MAVAACLLSALVASSLAACRNGLLSVAEQKRSYSLSVRAGAGGLVRSTGAAGSTLSEKGENGDSLSLTAIPASGYGFAGWAIASGRGKLGNAASATTSFTIDGADASLIASFNESGGAGVGVGTGAVTNLTVTVNGSNRIARTAAGATTLTTQGMATGTSANYSYTATIGAATVNSSVTSVAWYLDGAPVVTATASSVSSAGYPGVTTMGTGAADCGAWIVGPSLALAGGYQLTCQIVYGGNRYSGSARVLVSDQQPGSTKWSATWNSAGTLSDPALSLAGKVYVGSASLTGLQTYSVSSGTPSALSYSGTSPSYPAVDRDGRVAFISGGRPVLIDYSSYAVTGINTSLVGSPALGADGYIYAHDSGGTLYLVYDDGTSSLAPVAAVPMGGGFSSGPSIGADGSVFLGSVDGYLYAFHPGGGGLKWSFNAGGPVYSTPAVDSSGNVYVGSDKAGGSLFKISPAGTQLWECSFSAWGPTLHSGPILSPDGSSVYITGGTGSVAYIFAVDSVSGGLKTHNPFTATSYGSPAIAADGSIYFCVGDASSGRLYEMKDAGSSFNLEWQYPPTVAPLPHPTGTSSPAIGADGTIYITATDGANGYVYAIYGTAGPATTGWAMLGKNARRSGCASDAQ